VGGDGIHAIGTTVTALDCNLAAGAGGPPGFNCEAGLPGSPFEGFGATLIEVAEPHRSLVGPMHATDKAPLHLFVRGEPGDEVWVMLAQVPAFDPFQSPLGVGLVARPWLLPLAPMQTLDASGQGIVTYHFGDLATTGAGWVFHLQALVVPQGGSAVLSGAVQVLVEDT
jgi:hypothetical protein